MTAPVLERLTREHGYPLLTSEDLDGFLVGNEHSVLLFAGDPIKYPEALDVAVVLPELVDEFDGRLVPAVIAPEAEQALQARFGFSVWPTLVFMRGVRYLGAISRVRDWSTYLADIENLLAGETRRPPAVGIRVVDASPSGCAS